MARIIIVDDHLIFREGVAALVSASEADELVASLPDTGMLDEEITTGSADIVLLDLSFDGVLIYDEVERLKVKHPGLKIIMLSMHSAHDIVEKAMQAGADGYALKQDAFDDVLFAIRSVERGGRFISPTIMGTSNISITMEKPEVDQFPKRQREIIGLLAKGKSNKQIADELKIALPTVKNHLSVLFRKFGVQNRVELLSKLAVLNV